MRLDTIQQCPSLIGAELDFLEASEQFAALKHGASPPASRGNLRMETWELGVMDSKREVKRAHRKLSSFLGQEEMRGNIPVWIGRSRMAGKGLFTAQDIPQD